jgi:sec-independent protein translocase protein TatA
MASLTQLAFLTNPLEWAVVLIVGLLIFGRRLPEVGRSLGKGITEFKKGLSGIDDDVRQPMAPPPQNYQQLPPQQHYAPPGQPQQQLPQQPQAPYPQQPVGQVPYQQQPVQYTQPQSPQYAQQYPQQPVQYQQPQQQVNYPQQPGVPPTQPAAPTSANPGSHLPPQA